MPPPGRERGRADETPPWFTYQRTRNTASKRPRNTTAEEESLVQPRANYRPFGENQPSAGNNSGELWLEHTAERLLSGVQDAVGYPRHHEGNPLGATGAFADVRFVSTVLLVWALTVLVLFTVAGVFSNSFLHFGPANDLMFFNSPLDTWTKYGSVAIFTCVDQVFLTAAFNIVTPWVINDVQNRNQRTIEYSKAWVYRIRISYSIFFILSSVFRIAVSLSQISFILIMALSRVVIVVLLTRINLVGKSFNVERLPDLQPSEEYNTTTSSPPQTHAVSENSAFPVSRTSGCVTRQLVTSAEAHERQAQHQFERAKLVSIAVKRAACQLQEKDAEHGVPSARFGNLPSLPPWRDQTARRPAPMRQVKNVSQAYAPLKLRIHPIAFGTGEETTFHHSEPM
jgi:hypothetical protein